MIVLEKITFVDGFLDYHDISAKIDSLPKDWRGKEIAFGPSLNTEFCIYWGLFWRVGYKPTKAQVKEMLVSEGFELNPTRCHCRTGEPLTSEIY